MLVTDKYVFFYTSKFSQWYKRDFVVANVKYNCAEQFMMHQKALLFCDLETAEKIMATDDPQEHQDLGRIVKNFNAEIWDAACRDIVFEGNYAKFTQHEDLKELLLSYGKRSFVEASKKDKRWGIGMYSNTPGVEDPANWLGTNWLGEELTKVRDVILEEDENK